MNKKQVRACTMSVERQTHLYMEREMDWKPLAALKMSPNPEIK